jgi:hypothetical protein
VLWGLLSEVCSFGTWVPHGVRHAGVRFPREAESHCSCHLDFCHTLISSLAFLVRWRCWSLASRCRPRRCPLRPLLRHSASVLQISVASLAEVFARLRRFSIGVGGRRGRRPRPGWWRLHSLSQVRLMNSVTGYASDFRACCIATLCMCSGRGSTAVSFSSILVGARL